MFSVRLVEIRDGLVKYCDTQEIKPLCDCRVDGKCCDYAVEIDGALSSKIVVEAFDSLSSGETPAWYIAEHSCIVGTYLGVTSAGTFLANYADSGDVNNVLLLRGTRLHYSVGQGLTVYTERHRKVKKVIASGSTLKFVSSVLVKRLDNRLALNLTSGEVLPVSEYKLELAIGSYAIVNLEPVGSMYDVCPSNEGIYKPIDYCGNLTLELDGVRLRTSDPNGVEVVVIAVDGFVIFAEYEDKILKLYNTSSTETPEVGHVYMAITDSNSCSHVWRDYGSVACFKQFSMRIDG